MQYSAMVLVSAEKELGEAEDVFLTVFACSREFTACLSL